MKLTGGEINLYKVTGVIAGPFVVCYFFTTNLGFPDCIAVAYEKLRVALAKELKVELAPPKGSTDKSTLEQVPVR